MKEAKSSVIHDNLIMGPHSIIQYNMQMKWVDSVC